MRQPCRHRSHRLLRLPVGACPPRPSLTLAVVVAASLIGARGPAVTPAHAADARQDAPRWERVEQSDRPLSETIQSLAVHPDGAVTVAARSRGAAWIDRLLVTCVEADGQVRWTHLGPSDYESLRGSHAVALDGMVVVGSDRFSWSDASGRLDAYDTQGRLHWSRTGFGPVRHAIADGLGGVVYAPGSDELGPPNSQFGVCRVDRAGEIERSRLLPYALCDPRDAPPGPPSSRPLQLDAEAYRLALFPSGEVYALSAMFCGVGLHRVNWGDELEYEALLDFPPHWLDAGGLIILLGRNADGGYLARFTRECTPIWTRTWPSLGQPAVACVHRGMIHVADLVPGPPNASGGAGSVLWIAALDLSGAIVWERWEDAGASGTAALGAFAVAHDTTLVVTSTIDDRFTLHRVALDGTLRDVQQLAPGTAAKRVIARRDDGDVVAGASVQDATGDSDVLLVELPATGELQELARVAAHETVTPAALQVSGDETIVVAHAFGDAYRRSIDRPGGRLVALGLDGDERWRVDLVDVGVSDAAVDHDGRAMLLVVDDGGVGVRTYDGAGQPGWERALTRSFQWVLTTASGRALLHGRFPQVLALDVDGATLWEYEAASTVRSIAAAADDAVVMADWAHRVTLLAADGVEQWTRDVHDSMVIDAVALGDDGLVYVSGRQPGYGVQTLRTTLLAADGAIAGMATEPVARTGSMVKAFPGGGVIVGATVEAGAGQTDALVIRYTPMVRAEGLDAVWRHRFDGPGSRALRDLALDAEGNVLVALYESAPGGAARVVVLDAAGERVREHWHGTTSADVEPLVLVAGPRGEAILAGQHADGAAFVLLDEEPVPVEVTRLEAHRDGDVVRVAWTLGAGPSPIGFHVAGARLVDGPYARLHGAMLEASARTFVATGDPGPFYVLEVVERDGALTRHGPVVASGDAPGTGVPARVVIEAPRPNPAAGAVGFRFALPAARHVRLLLADAGGRVVAVPLDATLPAGAHVARWDGRDHGGRPVPRGVYFYRFEIGERVRTGKVVWGR